MASDQQVVTPEAVVLEFDTAGLGSRLLAGALDVGVQFLGLIVVVFAASFVAAAAPTEEAGGVVVGAIFVAMFLALFGYPVAMEALWRGRTLGKAAMGLRVVTVEGAPVRFRHAALRNAPDTIDKFAFGGLLSVLTVLLSRRNQSLGDLVAGTIVLRERTGAGMPQAVAFTVPRGYEEYAARLDVAAMTPADYAGTRSFLLRAPSLPGPARADLALRLAVPLAGRLRHVPPAALDPELFLACVAWAYQRRSGPRAAAGPVSTRPSALGPSVWSQPGPAWAAASAPASPHGTTPAGGERPLEPGGFTPPR